MRVTKPLNYEGLKKDFIIVNVLLGIAVLTMLGYMVLQKIGVIPSMPCILHDVWHIYCPGCGGTRAIFAFLQGHILESLYYNPVIVLGVVLAMYYEIGIVVTLRKRNGKRYYSVSSVPWIVCGVILVAFTVVRNYLLLGQGYDMLQDFISR